MATTSLLDTKTVNLNETLGNGKKFLVPQFQRDYSWDEDNEHILPEAYNES